MNVLRIYSMQPTVFEPSDRQYNFLKKIIKFAKNFLKSIFEYTINSVSKL